MNLQFQDPAQLRQKLKRRRQHHWGVKQVLPEQEPDKVIDRDGFPTKEELATLIRSSTAAEICEARLFNSVPWLFAADSQYKPSGSYDEFRAAIADPIGAVFTDIFLVGSAAFGRSTNPRTERFLETFNDESDLDVVILSSDLFESVWKDLAVAYYAGYSELMAHHGKNVFRGFVVPPVKNVGSTLLNDLIKRISEMKRLVQLRTRVQQPLKYRIYKDRDSALAYHIHSLEKCKKRINS